MKTKLFVLVFIIMVLVGCKTRVQYVPIEKERIEYQDKYYRDSIFLYDSVLVKEKGDTIFLERYRYLYRDKLIRDSIYIHDSIPIPYEVPVPGPQVNYVTGFQNFQIWCGRILLSFIIGYLGFRFLKK
jgi:hypothetical protein